MTDNKIKITVTKDGPLIVEGMTTIEYEAGGWTKRKKTMYLCRCGGSKHKPFCDDTHKTNGFHD